MGKFKSIFYQYFSFFRKFQFYFYFNLISQRKAKKKMKFSGIFFILILASDIYAQRDRTQRQKRKQKKRLQKSPEGKMKKLRTLTIKWCNTFLSKSEHQEKCALKFTHYMDKMEASYDRCGQIPNIQRRKRETEQTDKIFNLEKEFLALLPTNTLITMRGIKPDTPIQKAPGIFSKILKATKFFISDHLMDCKKFVKLNRRVGVLVPRFVEKLKLEKSQT